ncbi:MAG: hypothetical protein EAZ11_03220 [Curvibacter sp.]|nr:MAG: hypothetical protein EAZ11_03220 [Curvibacter sp.]
MFRLSGREGPQYSLWTPESAGPAQAALIDVDSYEAGLELVSPSFNHNLKMICVGSEAPQLAWRTVPRPVEWAALVGLLDELFVVAQSDDDLGSDETEVHTQMPPGVKLALLAGLPKDVRLYLRARLALAGITVVDEVQTLEHMDDSVKARDYDVVLAYVNTTGSDPWVLVKHLQDLEKPVRSAIAVSADSSWKASNLAERMGCIGLLEIPFNPMQVIGLLQRV